MEPRIRILGDPILRQPCGVVADPTTTEIRQHAEHLRESLYGCRSRLGFGRGIAAPQIGESTRMVFTHVCEPLILINPRIQRHSRECFQMWDDCLSVPDILVRVARYQWVEVVYQDLQGEWHSLHASDSFAELLQHELDHLDGVLMIDRRVGPNALYHVEELKRQAEFGLTPDLPAYLRGVQ